MSRRKLPIGIQTLQEIREQDCYYVDKTPHIRRLIDKGSYYFLSRPRRFGKSLLLDTIRELFSGNEALFKGLAIHGDWDWSVRHPVLRLSLGGRHDKPGNLEGNLAHQLSVIERNAGLDPPKSPLEPAGHLRDLLDRLHQATGRRVVVLVDEYDKPIVDVIDQPELAAENRDLLKGFFSVIKDSASDVRFVFVTGVSMFSKVSLFSGLNNLRNISLDPSYATICGYTESDLDAVFAPELEGLDRAEVRRWYNGYSWLGEERLYNPFDLLLFFETREFEPHWFETGPPAFMFKLMVERGVSPLELAQTSASPRKLSKFDVADIDTEALLFQTGYLTIKAREGEGTQAFYTLEYPNLEVRQSLNQGLLEHLGRREEEVAAQGNELGRLLAANDFEGFAAHLKSFFAGIPYQWRTENGPARYEAWYAGMLYAFLNAVELDVRVEESSGRGRADMVVLHAGQVFVFEFKMTDGEDGLEAALDGAIAQIKEKGYAEKYRGGGEAIHLIGVAISKDINLVEVKAVSA